MSVSIIAAKSSSSAVGGFVLVGGATLTAAATTTISGLDGNTDKVYRIVVRGRWIGGDGIPMNMRPNGDTTSGNYRGVTFGYYVSGTLASSYTDSLIIARKIYASDNYTYVEADLAAANNQYRQVTTNVAWDNTASDGAFQTGGGSWLITSLNVTSIDFDFGGGTFTGTVNIYKFPY